ncbi:MAG: ADOP family duplicated permease [Candidatus Sulfotelmatobacter sp.]
MKGIAMTLNDLRLRIRALFLRARVEQELEDEVAFHVAMSRQRYLAAGHAEEEASRLARLDFGRVGAIKEDCRGARGIDNVESALQDIRYALRTFQRNPGFLLTVSGTIALGLGLNLALFTLFNAYVLRPLSIHDPYSLYRFTWSDRMGREHAFSWDEYQQLAKDKPAFSEVAAVQDLYTRVEGHAIEGELVTGNYFEMLGLGTTLGRTLLPEDSRVPGSEPLLVLSYRAWQSKFGGRPDIVGTTIMIRGVPMEVAGVGPRDFHGLTETPRDFWAPLSMAHRLQGGPDLFGAAHPEVLAIVGRLHSSQSVSTAEAGLMAWSQRMTAQFPNDGKAIGVLLQSQATSIPLTPELLLVFSPLVTAFALVLVLACTNVASMMLARATARQREIGIRLSLGAGRRRLIRQLLTESVLLSIPAAIFGLIISRLAIDAALWTVFATVPKDMLELVHDVARPVDWRVIAFMILAALVSALLFGLAPALQATRVSVMSFVRGELSSNLRPSRVRNGLVIAQITVCTLLLIACGALVRTTMRMTNFNIGFHTDHIVAIEPTEKGRSRVIDALSLDPAVERIAGASSVPMGGRVPTVTVSTQDGRTISTAHNNVSPAYFGILGIPILRGRNFTAQEATAEAPVTILSAATAARLFSGRDALGRTVRLESPARVVRIIGIAPDVVTCCIAYGKDAALLYLPAIASKTQNVLVQVRGEVEAERRRLETRLGAVAPGTINDIHSLDQYRAMGIYAFRAASMIGAAVGGLALLLTLTGIYGVVSYFVTQRTKEIGIRVALGATTFLVTSLVLKQSLRLTAFGVAIGTVLALVVARLLASQMIFMQVFDAEAFAGGLLLVVSATLAAGYIPSRRAAQIDPIQTLRYD